jgi:hypothetical protein
VVDPVAKRSRLAPGTQRKAGDADTDRDPQQHRVPRRASDDEISEGPALTADGMATCTVASISAGGYAHASVATRSGEHRLMVAILEDAVSILVKNLSGGIVSRRDFREAGQWLASRDRSLPFGFESICDALGFDSSYIRRGIRAARARPTEAAARFAVGHHGPGRHSSTAPPLTAWPAPLLAVASVA